MTTHSVQTTFRSLEWIDAPIGDPEATPKLTRASCKQAYRGDVEGESTLEYVMVLAPDGSADFVGVERVVGRLLGKRGSFALRHVGRFADGVARMSIEIVRGSGTAELAGLSGAGEFESPHATEYALTLQCSFDAD